MAEYCAIGGDVTKRVWAPLGEKDYSSYISQIPKDVDGIYVGIGGSGLISFIKQYKEQNGKVDTERMMGNVFWDDPLVLKEVGKDLVGGTTSAMTAADDDSPEVKAYIDNLTTSYGDEIAGAGPVGVHVRLLHGRPCADQGPRGRQRRHRRPGDAAGGARGRRACRARRPRGATSRSTTTARRSRTCS